MNLRVAWTIVSLGVVSLAVPMRAGGQNVRVDSRQPQLLLAGSSTPLRSSVLLAAPKLEPKTVAEWDAYIALTEKRIDAELRLPTVPPRSDLALLKTKKIQIDPFTTAGSKGKDISGGAIHHWLAAIYIPDVTLQTVIPWLQKYSQYQDYFKDVERSEERSHIGDTYEIFLRLKRSKLGRTAHFDTTHNVVYSRKSPSFVSSVSRSKEIRQVKDAGTSLESLYPVGDDDGYLWRLNAYWRFTERDGGVVVECETVGLSRSLGWGLGILNFFTLGKVKSIANSIAEEALEETLTDLRNGVKGGPRKAAR